MLAIGGIVAGIVLLYLSRDDRIALWLTGAAVACLVAGLIITLTVHFPINDKVETWNPATAPGDAAELLERRRTANTVRTATAIVGFALLLLPALFRPAGVRSEHGERDVGDGDGRTQASGGTGRAVEPAPHRSHDGSLATRAQAEAACIGAVGRATCGEA